MTQGERTLASLHLRARVAHLFLVGVPLDDDGLEGVVGRDRAAGVAGDVPCLRRSQRAADPQRVVQPHLDAVRASLTMQFGQGREQFVREPAGLAVSATRLGDLLECRVGGGGELFAAKCFPDVAAQVDTSADQWPWVR